MTTTNIDSYGLSQTYMNDNLVHDIKWDANYNGDRLNVGLSENSHGNKGTYFIQLDNADIMNILSQPANKKSLEERLETAFGTMKSQKRHTKRHRHKSTKHRHTKGKHYRHHHKSRKRRRRKHSQKKRKTPSIDQVIY